MINGCRAVSSESKSRDGRRVRSSAALRESLGETPNESCDVTFLSP